MSTQNIYNAVIRAAAHSFRSDASHLDVGAGRGELIGEVRKHANVKSFACDFHIERFAADVPCEKVNFNDSALPYRDEQFDVITSSEVVEHLENYRLLLRELFRIAKKDGTVVITTPNVLNLTSRLRYFISGFANLFGPLPLRNDALYSTGAHITPIPFFYLAHALADAGFDEIKLSIDKAQRTSTFYAVLFYPLIALGKLRFMARERKRYRTITTENKPMVEAHFSWNLLVGRTIVVSARKR